MKNYKLSTLEKMLSKWEMKYYEETVKPYSLRGYKTPSLNSWNTARIRVEELKAAIAERKKELEENKNVCDQKH